MAVRILMGHQREQFGWTGPRIVRGVDSRPGAARAGLKRLRKYNRRPRRTSAAMGNHAMGHQMSQDDIRAKHNKFNRFFKRLQAKTRRLKARAEAAAVVISAFPFIEPGSLA